MNEEKLMQVLPGVWCVCGGGGVIWSQKTVSILDREKPEGYYDQLSIL